MRTSYNNEKKIVSTGNLEDNGILKEYESTGELPKEEESCVEVVPLDNKETNEESFEDIIEDETTEEDIDIDDGEENDKKIITIIVVSAVIISILLIISVAIITKKVKNINQSKEETTEEIIINSIEDFQKEIDELYTSDKKIDVKSNVTQLKVNNLKAKLDDFNESQVTSIKYELDTISMFIQDKENIGRYSSTSYDLSSVGLLENLEGISKNAEEYTIPGLSLTINNQVSIVKNEYIYYTDLLEELKGINNYEGFDATEYLNKINKVTHEPNKQTLIGYYNSIVSLKEEAESQKQKEEEEAEAERQKELEDAIAAQEEAEKAREEAEKAREEAEKEAEEARRKLEESTTTQTPTTQVTTEQNITEDILEE